MRIVLFIFLFFILAYATDPVKIVYNSGTPPLKFTDKNKKANGMLIDIWKLWAKKNNIKIKFIEASWKDTLQMIQDGRADIHAGIYYTKERDKFLDYSKKPLYSNKSYFFYDKNIPNITSIKDLKPYVIGIGNGYPRKYMKEYYPDFFIKAYKNSDQLSEALINNKVKVILSSMPTFVYHLSKNYIKIKQYKFSDSTLTYAKNYYGAVKKGNSKLLKLIDDGFKKISNKELKSIELNWTSKINEHYLNFTKPYLIFPQAIATKDKEKFIEKIDYSMLYKAFFGFIVIVSFFIFWNRRLEKEIQRRKEIEEQLKIQKKQLEKETKKAQSATVAKSEFLAKMSHEIRTPMNAVLGMLYLLKKTNLTASQESYISKATNAANSLLTIINDILDISKVEAGKFDIIEEEFVFNDMLQETMDIMSFKANEKGCELLAYYDFSIPKIVISDSNRIKQILTNIISNAIKFTDDGEIVVSTKLLKDNSKKLTIMFCIKDTGIGIEKKALDKLFQDFSQADNSITRKFGGTGLGLTISKKLVNMLDGDIWVEESKVGIGSTFCFTITVKKAKNISSTLYDTTVDLNKQKISQNVLHIKQSKSNECSFIGIKILLVEDNQLNQDFAKELLQSVNISVDIANDGLEAVELVKHKIYDIVLMDIQMPNMDGLTATKHIRAMGSSDEYFKKLPIIALSANALSMHKQLSLESGLNEHITKPIDPKELFDTLKKFLKNINLNVENNSISNYNLEVNSKILDTQEAIRRLNGNETAYIKLLKQFAKKYTTIYETINKLRHGDIDILEKKIHEIKGVLGNLGAKKVFLLLQNIDTILKTKNMPQDYLFTQLKVDLDELFTEIDRLTEEKTQKKDFNKEKVLELLDTIKQNLEDDIVKASETLEELEPYLQKNYKDIADNLRDLLNEFDTDGVKDVIVQSIDKILKR